MVALKKENHDRSKHYAGSYDQGTDHVVYHRHTIKVLTLLLDEY